MAVRTTPHRPSNSWRNNLPRCGSFNRRATEAKEPRSVAGCRQHEAPCSYLRDADGATPIEELPHLESALAAGADLAIGSRALASHDPNYTVQARWHRSMMGSLFNAVVQRFGLRHIADTQCGFKLFRRSVAQDLFSVACVDGYAFDLELLYIARQRGFRIAEVPVNWADQPGSKVRPWRDGFLMLRELMAIRNAMPKGDICPALGQCSAASSLRSAPNLPT